MSDRGVTSDHGSSAGAVDESYPSLRRNRNFLGLLFGRLVTNAGDSLYAVAAVWLVHNFTGSTVYTGIAEALLLLPLVLQFLSGPLVDRWPIVRALVVIQLVQAVAILSLPVAAYTGHLSVELIFVTIPLLALLNQFIYPAQSAALPRVVPDDQLTRANSAFSFAFHGVDMLFEAVGGLLIALVGTTLLFVLDSVTFVLAALLFVGVRVPATDGSPGGNQQNKSVRVSRRPGQGNQVPPWVGVRRTDVHDTTMVSNFGVGMTLAVLPGFTDIRAGPALFGAMLGALGVGRALGAVIASRLETVEYGHVTIVGPAGSCLLWLGAVYAPSPSLAVGLFLLAWVPPGVMGVMANTLEQTVTPDHLLGRVASVTASAWTLTLSIGALLGGLMGSTIGAVTTMAVGGLTFGFVSLYSLLRPRLRRLPAMNDIDPAAFDMRAESLSVSEGSDRE